LHLADWDVSKLPLVERKALLERLVTNMPGLLFNGHDTGVGEVILVHAGKLGFEGVVSKTIDAPYIAPTPFRTACATDRSCGSGRGDPWRTSNDPGRRRRAPSDKEWPMVIAPILGHADREERQRERRRAGAAFAPITECRRR
jgi:hypothetical protein